MRILTIFVLTNLITCVIYAQTTGKITGTVTDAQSKQILEGATISVLNQETGIFINHGVSNRKGEFQVTGLPQNIVLDVIISFTGYRDSSATFTIDNKVKILNTGNWKMKVGS